MHEQDGRRQCQDRREDQPGDRDAKILETAKRCVGRELFAPEGGLRLVDEGQRADLKYGGAWHWLIILPRAVDSPGTTAPAQT